MPTNKPLRRCKSRLYYYIKSLDPVQPYRDVVDELNKMLQDPVSTTGEVRCLKFEHPVTEPHVTSIEDELVAFPEESAHYA